MSRMDVRFDEFRSKMAALLSEYADVVGPTACAIHGREPGGCDCSAEEAAVPIPDVYPSNWVLVHQWANLGEGGPTGYWDWHTDAGFTMVPLIGLLTTALDDARARVARV